LEETHADRKHKPDFGVMLGQWLVNRFCYKQHSSILSEKDAQGNLLETYSLLEDEVPPPEYRTNENTPRQSSSAEPVPLEVLEKQIPSKPQRTFTRQIILLIINYGILA
jgi:hypothetical protein